MFFSDWYRFALAGSSLVRHIDSKNDTYQRVSAQGISLCWLCRILFSLAILGFNNDCGKRRGGVQDGTVRHAFEKDRAGMVHVAAH